MGQCKKIKKIFRKLQSWHGNCNNSKSIYYYCKNYANLGVLRKKMEKKEKYFQDIAREIHQKRLHKGFDEQEQAAYLEGKKTALREVLISFGTQQTNAALKQRFERAIKFLEKESQGNKILVQEADTDLWDSDLTFTAQELMSFVDLQISDLQARLAKAREIHQVQAALIENFTQMTID